MTPGSHRAAFSIDVRAAEVGTDEKNCGGCGQECPAGGDVRPGRVQLRAACTFCSPDCADLSTSRKHCGSCDDACAAAEICKNGSCVPCPPTHLVCDGVCIDPATTEKHCGSCTNACATGQQCTDGICG